MTTTNTKTKKEMRQFPNAKQTTNNEQRRRTYQNTPPMENSGLMAFFSIFEKFRIVHVHTPRRSASERERKERIKPKQQNQKKQKKKNKKNPKRQEINRIESSLPS
jgi:hypothetical protein